MTANQVAYWQLQEAKRHNIVSEGQIDTQNAAQRTRWEKQSTADLRNSASNIRNANANEANAETNRRNSGINAANAIISGLTGAANNAATWAKIFI